ncbi:uncharacterized protein LOC119292508 [Triticum dicoccoides]|uniref:uncharacterized protein LOC119292508 n=1 Tax=Triticum dicoccoides TaxID=85692 RepID=UPI00188E62D9|nr:uncharacterized protein LOC119292508 [Triticum dicoccoides]
MVFEMLISHRLSTKSFSQNQGDSRQFAPPPYYPLLLFPLSRHSRSESEVLGHPIHPPQPGRTPPPPHHHLRDSARCLYRDLLLRAPGRANAVPLLTDGISTAGLTRESAATYLRGNGATGRKIITGYWVNVRPRAAISYERNMKSIGHLRDWF